MGGCYGRLWEAVVGGGRLLWEVIVGGSGGR